MVTVFLSHIVLIIDSEDCLFLEYGLTIVIEDQSVVHIMFRYSIGDLLERDLSGQFVLQQLASEFLSRAYFVE